ncbi:MAG: hypothetical protein J6Q58_05045 [Clostridia bacterium]|nr:hypothetical protein [Clostridia bacterium]
MKITKVGNIIGGQDGAIYGSELFRFNSKGDCTVYDLKEVKGEQLSELKAKSEFKLDRYEEIVPHSNSVCFSSEFYEGGDEYPLLYSNIYNNYLGAEDEMLGVCLVYRIQRIGNEYKSTLVQLIKIDFCEDAKLWKAHEDKHGVRPYGNFVVDKESKSYWAFTMRNEELGTRYFKFDLPKVSDGEVDEDLGVKKVVLKDTDIKEYFDCEYHRYIQGAILNNGKIYSTEGFRNDNKNHPAIRIIDLNTKKEDYYDIMNLGFTSEPEFIDFYNDTCFYSDYEGNLYKIEF